MEGSGKLGGGKSGSFVKEGGNLRVKKQHSSGPACRETWESSGQFTLKDLEELKLQQEGGETKGGTTYLHRAFTIPNPVMICKFFIV